MRRPVRSFLFILLLFTALPLVAFGKSPWNEYKGTHFIIYYKDAPMSFVQSVEAAAENYYQEIAETLGFTRYKGWSWDARAKIFIYQDEEDYVNTSRQMRWSHGAASTKEKEIRTFPSAHGFFDSTLPHELGHIIFREFIGYSAQIPLWLEEGVAMYQEKAKRWGSNKLVQEAMASGTFLTLSEMDSLQLSSNSPRALIDLFYSESASAVYFMITELGEYRFVNFCHRLKEGDSFEQALQSAYVRFRNMNDLNKVWVDYLKK